jgi:phosphopantothenoylcysteine decarboxylase / phosphopantothenate---cysteine ligase
MAATIRWRDSLTLEMGDEVASHIIITAGPTHEPIDPVRYIANRSSGRQGFAIAEALAKRGAKVTLIAGPVALETPQGVTRINIETARDMAAAVDAALPADAAIMVAAVADWRVEGAEQKIKKDSSGAPPTLTLVENPDILATLCRNPKRPPLVVGFAAETENVIPHAQAKLAKKGCDWIVANDVSGDVMGGEANSVHIITPAGVESWDRMAKEDVADRLADRVLRAMAETAA